MLLCTGRHDPHGQADAPVCFVGPRNLVEPGRILDPRVEFLPRSARLKCVVVVKKCIFCFVKKNKKNIP